MVDWAKNIKKWKAEKERKEKQATGVSWAWKKINDGPRSFDPNHHQLKIVQIKLKPNKQLKL